MGDMLVGGFKHFLFSISYMGCYPSHWRTHMFQDVFFHHQPGLVKGKLQQSPLSSLDRTDWQEHRPAFFPGVSPAAGQDLPYTAIQSYTYTYAEGIYTNTCANVYYHILSTYLLIPSVIYHILSTYIIYIYYHILSTYIIIIYLHIYVGLLFIIPSVWWLAGWCSKTLDDPEHSGDVATHQQSIGDTKIPLGHYPSPLPKESFLVDGLEHFLCFHRLGIIWNHHPNCYSLIFFRGVGQPPIS